jgi:nitrite reductase (NADH) small subunit
MIEGANMSDWIEVGLLRDIPVRGSRIVKQPGRHDIAVFRAADDHVFALVDRCPHKGGPLSQGIVHGHSVSCPLHNWNIALATGEAKAPDRGCVPSIPVRMEGDRIFVAGALDLAAAA